VVIVLISNGNTVEYVRVRTTESIEHSTRKFIGDDPVAMISQELLLAAVRSSTKSTARRQPS
jgi:hypothetical protein